MYVLRTRIELLVSSEKQLICKANHVVGRQKARSAIRTEALSPRNGGRTIGILAMEADSWQWDAEPLSDGSSFTFNAGWGGETLRRHSKSLLSND